MKLTASHCGCSKNFWHPSIKEGRIEVNVDKTYNADADAGSWNYTIVDGTVEKYTHQWESNNKWYEEHVEYGVGRKLYEGNRQYSCETLVEETKYRKGTIMSIQQHYEKEPAATNMQTGELMGKQVVIHTTRVKNKVQYYGDGTWKGHKVVYENGQVAYEYKYGNKQLTINDDQGRRIAFIKGIIDTDGLSDSRTIIPVNAGWNQVWDKDDPELFRLRARMPKNNWRSTPEASDIRVIEVTIYDAETQRVTSRMRKENNQLQGEVLRNDKYFHYINGVAISKEMFYAKPEDLDCNEVLKIPNAQVRASFIKKVGINRIVDQCKATLIEDDKENDYQLLSIQMPHKGGEERIAGDTEMRILKVVCTTTKQVYTLRVPPTVNTVREARDWTFGIGDNWQDVLRKSEIETLEFTKET